MIALMMREYHWSYEEALRRDPCLMNALYAALCESNGLSGRWTYRDDEIQEHLPEIMAGKYKI